MSFRLTQRRPVHPHFVRQMHRASCASPLSPQVYCNGSPSDPVRISESVMVDPDAGLP